MLVKKFEFRRRDDRFQPEGVAIVTCSSADRGSLGWVACWSGSERKQVANNNAKHIVSYSRLPSLVNSSLVKMRNLVNKGWKTEDFASGGST
jgi:hypothetical protein